MHSVIIEEVATEMTKLSQDAQRRVLEYARSLMNEPTVDPDTIIERCAGILSHEDAEAMRLAIDEDCERIDAQRW